MDGGAADERDGGFMVGVVVEGGWMAGGWWKGLEEEGRRVAK